MEEKQGLQELLEELKDSNRKQANYGKWQFIFTCLSALCCVGIFALVLSLMPQVQDLAAQMESVLTNLEDITTQLAETDLNGMVDNVDALVNTSQQGVEQAMKKLNAIDFDTLNQAIQNLADVVEPLAKFFNIFNR